MSNQQPPVCIVIPCYNEEARLPVDEIRAFIHKPEAAGVTLLFVNDGSTDGTERVIQGLVAENPAVYQYYAMPANGGKAEAVRNGMLQALSLSKADYIAFFDADLATPLEEVAHFFRFCENKAYPIMVGSRLLRLGANVSREPLRHYFGRVFNTVVCNMIHISIYDTQCGAKMFHRSLVEPLFSKPFMSKWLFDVELFLRYRNLVGRSQLLETVMEIPLRTWIEKGGSKVKASTFLKAPMELWRITSHYDK